MTLTDLITAVKECCDITSKNISLKLSYQYPEWVAMGDRELDMPQYITDDTDVGVFIRMRRAVEEVDLYVSIVRLSDTGTSSHIPRQLGLNVREDVEDAGDNIIDEDEWHNFAISETPLTFPPTQKKGKDTDHVVPESSVQRRRSSTIKSRTILRSTCGIEIREPRANIPRAPPASVATDKGKNKRPIEYENDSDSDSDDAMVVPVLSTIIPASATADRPVARRLVFGVPEIPNLDGDDGSSSSSAEGPPEEVEEFGQHWGKFDEALHEMLNDPYTPALFGKDAPPCI